MQVVACSGSAERSGTLNPAPSLLPRSTGVRSRPVLGPHTPLTAWERTGRGKGRPDTVHPTRMMDASPNSPRSGESVSDAQFDQQEFLKQWVDGEIDGILDSLRRGTVTQGNDLADRYEAVQRARYELELLQTVLDDQLGGDDLELRLGGREDLKQ